MRDFLRDGGGDGDTTGAAAVTARGVAASADCTSGLRSGTEPVRVSRRGEIALELLGDNCKDRGLPGLPLLIAAAAS
jgi:hypothetical protein